MTKSEPFPRAVFETNVAVETPAGRMVVRLHQDRAPVSTRYFLDDVDRGLYASSSIFRIVTVGNRMPGASPAIEVMQGGWRPIDLQPSIVHETTEITGLRHRRGTISLARFRPGGVYHSFFICFRDESVLDYGGGRHLDGQGFAAFGDMVEGWPVLDWIRDRAEANEMLEVPISIGVVRC